MGTTLPTEAQSTQAEAPAGQEPESQGQAANWTSADLQVLADKVYELLLRDLLIERERGLW